MLKKYFYIVATLLVILAALALIYWNTIEITFADVFYDNKVHNYSCSDLPNREVVEKALDDHKDIVTQIEDISPRFIDVEVGIIDKCPDKADIVIYFPGHKQREMIEELIETDLLFGIPYRMINY